MPPDTELKEMLQDALTAARPSRLDFTSGEAPSLPPGVSRYVAPRGDYFARLKAPSAPAALARAARPVRNRLASLTDHLSATTRRRARTALTLAVALNAVVLTLLSFYGVVRIWIPGAPGETHVVMLDLPTQPLPLPDLRDAETQPVPPEEVKPEIVEKPEIKPEPEPKPAPEDKAEAPPAPKEAEPEPPPSLPDLEREPDFAPPDESAPLIPEPSLPAPQEEPELSVGRQPQPEPQQQPQGAQTPAETPEPLVRPGAQPDDGAKGEDAAAEEERRKAEEEAARRARETKAPEAVEGDDAFDQAPTLGARAALPKVDLPAGAASGAPGDSGVVAIYCPKQFRKNKDKAEECAGRTEIRSGWKPGASGEDWSRAVDLLKQARRRGQSGAEPGVTFAPGAQRRLDEDFRNRDAPTRVIGGQSPAKSGMGGVEAPAPAPGDNLDAGIDRSQSAPKDFAPPDQRRDRAPLSDAELKKLREQMEKAEKERPN